MQNLSVEPGRREFLSAAAGSLAVLGSNWAIPKSIAEDKPALPSSETAVKAFFETLTDEQKKEICFAWDYKDPRRGLLRTRVSNNWQITKPQIESPYFTKKQKSLLHDAFQGLFSPEWYPKMLKQLRDDSGGKPWGAEQSVALFGTPGNGPFEMVMTGRHLTMRVDGNSENHVAFGGPIFHGHAPKDHEEADHPGNVFWEQAVAANKVYTLLDGKQRKQAMVEQRPYEADVPFQGKEKKLPGLAMKDMSTDQLAEVQKTLKSMLSPYREIDRAEAMKCLEKQGGLAACSLMYYSAGDIGKDQVWDNWRIEGPSFVWYFRGEPHVHLWINIADSSEVKLNAVG